jgi:serine phosphatase RsbU (regulator of sigma subunit)
MQEMSQRLRNSEDATVRDLRQKNQQLQHAYEELKAAQAGLLAKERMEAELATARRIQQGLLPKQMPDLPGWSITAHWEPAREVSGDFFDFLFFPDGQVGLVIGDVTGKGVPAALVMATTRSVLRAAAQTAGELGLVSPGWLLAKANDLLVPDMPPVMFVTCLIAIFNPSDGRLVLANAGHCLPFLQSAGKVVELRAAGMPLGLMPGMNYEECSTVIAAGESLLLYSDGLLEAHNPQGEMFGKNRIGAHLINHACDRDTGGDLIAELLQALAEFSGPGWEQEDDVTFVVLQSAA